MRVLDASPTPHNLAFSEGPVREVTEIERVDVRDLHAPQWLVLAVEAAALAAGVTSLLDAGQPEPAKVLAVRLKAMLDQAVS